MIALSNKSKQYLVFALKVSILCVTFGYICAKITSEGSVSLGDFIKNTEHSGLKLWTSLLVFSGLVIINWFFEILKWKRIVSHLENLSFLDATKQSLSALTISLATPNRIGEYGAKAYFFPKEKRKQVLLLTFFSNAAQMVVTTVFGTLGLLVVSQIYNLPLSSIRITFILVLIIALFGLGYIFKEKELLIKGFSITKVARYFKKISVRIKRDLILFSILRYVAFSVLFYLLLQFFGGQIHAKQIFPLIASMYLLSSILPTIFIFDVAVKGGVALWLFSLTGIPELIVLSTVFSMWLLNFVLPAVIGSFYVVAHKSSAQ